MADRVAVLRASPYFREMGDDHLSLLATVTEERQYNNGEFLTREQQPRMEAFFILEGQVERFRSVDEQKCTFEMLNAGQTFGLLHCLHEDASYANAVAKGTVRVLILHSDGLTKLLDSNAALGKAFTFTLARTVRSYSKLVSNPVAQKPRLVLFNSKSYWQEHFDRVNNGQNFGFEIRYVRELLSPDTAPWTEGAVAAICFVNDTINQLTLQRIQAVGCKMVALRCAGFDNVDRCAARGLGILITRVPEYSPYAVAEHAMALTLALNRHLGRAYTRTREHNFKLEGLLGFDMHEKTVGVLGTGRIGQIFINICLGFGMQVVCYDKYPSKSLAESGKVEYTTLDEVLRQSDIISLHTPLLPDTYHMVNSEAISKMKKGVIIINCGRGGLIDTDALIEGLRSGHIGGAGLDVYEKESEFFFDDHSDDVVGDTSLQILLQFNNVLMTAHQAFFTEEGLTQIAMHTLNNVKMFLEGKDYDTHPNVVKC